MVISRFISLAVLFGCALVSCTTKQHEEQIGNYFPNIDHVEVFGDTLRIEYEEDGAVV